MLSEILESTYFLAHFLRGKKMGPPEETVELFCQELSFLLFERVNKSWHPADPVRGSGLRAITHHNQLDHLLVRAGESAGIGREVLSRLIPMGLTCFTDPGSASFRINFGPECVFYKKLHDIDKIGGVSSAPIELLKS